MPIKIFTYNEELDAFSITDAYCEIAAELGLQEWNPVVWMGRLFAMDNDYGEHWQDDFDLREAKAGEDYDKWFIVDPVRFKDGKDGPCHSDEIRKRFWTEVLKCLELPFDFLADLAREQEKRYNDLGSHGIDLEDRIGVVRAKVASGTLGAPPMSDLQKKITSLVFYQPGDEAGELFQATCSLCYQMHGLGYDEEAETLYQWAEKMATNSKEWVIEQGETLEDAYSENGNWGY